MVVWLGGELSKGAMVTANISIPKDSCPDHYSFSHHPELVNLIPPHVAFVLFLLLPLVWSIEQVNLCADLLRVACIGFPQPFVPLGYNPH